MTESQTISILVQQGQEGDREGPGNRFPEHDCRGFRSRIYICTLAPVFAQQRGNGSDIYWGSSADYNLYVYYIETLLQISALEECCCISRVAHCYKSLWQFRIIIEQRPQ